MKARLIRDGKHTLLLCNDGTISAVNDLILYDFLTDFRRNDLLFTGTLGKWTNSCPDMSVYPGDTIAFISDDNSLVVYDFEPFAPLMNAKVKMRGYISCAEFAKRHNKSTEIIKVYCRNGRIPGAKKVARNWLIPENAEYPIEPERRRESVRKSRPHTRKSNA